MQGDRASILWTLPYAGDGRVVAAGPDGATRTVAARVQAFDPASTKLASRFYQYQADMTGLGPGSRYSYRVTVDGATLANGASFQTASAGSFSFVAFGDSGQNTPEQLSLISRMASEPGLSFLLHTGDLAYPNGTFALYDSNYFGLNAPLFERLPVFPTPGNHDYLVDYASAFVTSHALPQNGVNPAASGRYYSFDWGSAHFACADSNLMLSAAQEDMLAWLDNDLASSRQFWKIVCLHHPPYPTGHHAGDVMCTAVHDFVIPIVERHGVHLVLAGHEHGYERTVPLAADRPAGPGRGTVYVITGGGGGDLHDVNTGGLTEFAIQAYHYLRVDAEGGALTLRAIGLNGAEIERYVIQPKPAIQDRGVMSIGDYGQTLAPGSLVSIFGANLAIDSRSASETPPPLEMAGTRVRIGGREAPLLYASPGQVNAQIPYDADPECTLEVVTPNGSAQANLFLHPTAPSIIAVTFRGSPATSSNAPSAGDAAIVYATGLGQSRQAAVADAAAGNTARIFTPVAVLLGNLEVQPTFAGLAAGFDGLDQINFTIPPDMASGTYPLRIATPDGSSRVVQLVVQ